MIIFESWAKSLDARELDEMPGIVFLRMWLRRGTLEPIIARELGSNGLDGGWTEYGRARCKAFPLGVVGHWPAGNVEIQPILSMTCALLGGNAALVRIPSGLVDLTRLLMDRLVQSDPAERLTRRIFMAAFDHGRQDLHEAMAQGRRWSDDLGRGRSCFAGSRIAVSPLGSNCGFRAADIRRGDGRGGLGQSRRTEGLVPAHGPGCLAI